MSASVITTCNSAPVAVTSWNSLSTGVGVGMHLQESDLVDQQIDLKISKHEMSEILKEMAESMQKLSKLVLLLVKIYSEDSFPRPIGEKVNFPVLSEKSTVKNPNFEEKSFPISHPNNLPKGKENSESDGEQTSDSEYEDDSSSECDGDEEGDSDVPVSEDPEFEDEDGSEVCMNKPQMLVPNSPEQQASHVQSVPAFTPEEMNDYLQRLFYLLKLGSDIRQQQAEFPSGSDDFETSRKDEENLAGNVDLMLHDEDGSKMCINKDFTKQATGEILKNSSGLFSPEPPESKFLFIELDEVEKNLESSAVKDSASSVVNVEEDEEFETTPISLKLITSSSESESLFSEEMDEDTAESVYSVRSDDEEDISLEHFVLPGDLFTGNLHLEPINLQEPTRLSILRLLQSFEHACQKGDADCLLTYCQKMKRKIEHAKGCEQNFTDECQICKWLVTLCMRHAKHCLEAMCPTPYCHDVKLILLQRHVTFLVPSIR